jgi:FixJ family two-component response regulator
MKVMVLDDDNDYRRMVVVALRAQGHDVVERDNSADFVQHVLAATPDVLVLDCHLPGITGPEVLALLAEEPKCARIGVLLVSAANTPHFSDSAHSHGRALFMQKPARLSQLIRAIETFAKGWMSDNAEKVLDL